MNYSQIIKKLKSMRNQYNVDGMKRFGIDGKNMLGISNTELRAITKEIGKDHELALRLWNSKIHEAGILACLIDEPKKVTKKQMDKWANDFDNWGTCDSCCMHLFDRTPYAYEKINQWSKNKKEFVKRAAFALIASLAVHDKKAEDKIFIDLLPIIKRESTDERNFVRKAVNWALRQIGKRNKHLNKEAIKAAKEIEKIDSKAARWIAKDALRELQSEAVQKRLR